MATPLTPTDLSIVNQALTAILGEDEISVLATDTEKRAVIMRNSYESVSESCQVAMRWKFNTKKVALAKNAATSVNRWSQAYDLPSDFLKLITVWPPGNYQLLNGLLWSNNTDSIEIDYQSKEAESTWPTWFQRYVVIRLAMRTCRGITGDFPDQDMKDELKDAREDAFFQDSQQQPNEVDMPNALVDCRH